MLFYCCCRCCCLAFNLFFIYKTLFFSFVVCNFFISYFALLITNIHTPNKKKPHNKTHHKQKQTKNKQINKWKIIITIKSTAHARTHACTLSFRVGFIRVSFIFIFFYNSNSCGNVRVSHSMRTRQTRCDFPSRTEISTTVVAAVAVAVAAIICNFKLMFIVIFCLISLWILVLLITLTIKLNNFLFHSYCVLLIHSFYFILLFFSAHFFFLLFFHSHKWICFRFVCVSLVLSFTIFC